MKIALMFVLFFLTTLSSADEHKDSLQLFDFAEIAYPEYFSPAGAAGYEFEGYLVREYSCCDIYLATKK